MKIKTDLGKIQYPVGLSTADRRHLRRMIVTVAGFLRLHDKVIISCSGGIDSTALAHACGQAMLLMGDTAQFTVTAVYLNHHLRPEAVETESRHVENLSATYLSYVTPSISLDVAYGHSLQERARKARYAALSNLVANIQEANPSAKIAIFTAHNQDDDAETKLFQFMRGQKEQPGIPTTRSFDEGRAVLQRPLLDFSRKEIERYVRCFGLTWCEDSSNATNKYTRNKIRHQMIPWILENVNPGFVKMLSKMRKDI